MLVDGWFSIEGRCRDRMWWRDDDGDDDEDSDPEGGKRGREDLVG